MSTPQAGNGGGVLGILRVAGLTAGVTLVLVGALVLGAGPLLYRAKMLDLDGATAGMGRWSLLAFAAAALAALIGLVASLAGKRHRGAIVSILVLVAAGTGAGMLYSQSVLRAELPPINDVQTDWGNPVAFTEQALGAREAEGAVKVRDDAVIPEGSGKWSGKTFAEAQKGAAQYDDLKPLIVRAKPADATVAAANAAKRLGWDVMMSDPPAGQMEAVNHTFWYGLTSDIAVRIVPEGTGSRVDVRSTSRLPNADMGANAAQVKEFLDEIALELR
jgi:fatty-acyl-CoA synthase